MATGTGNLPNVGMSFSPFAILTAQEMNDLVENIESLATGAGIGDAAVQESKIDLTSFQAPARVTGTNATAVTVNTTLVTTSYTVRANRPYLLTFNASTAFVSTTGSVWELQFRVGTTVLFATRIENTPQRGSSMIDTCIPVAAATGTFNVLATRLTGSGALTVESPRISILPQPYST